MVSENLDRNIFECTICKQRFADGRSLGGHASRAHTGMSDVFNKKKQIREHRAIERNALSQA